MTHAQVLTNSSGDDARTRLKVIKKTEGKLSSVPGDVASYSVVIYNQAGSRGARVVVPRSSCAESRGCDCLQDLEPAARFGLAPLGGYCSLNSPTVREIIGH
ncbi:MAG: hypothetical protein ACI9HE_004054 [Planctomycetota bacterium]|jgi:hypothetical protein